MDKKKKLKTGDQILPRDFSYAFGIHNGGYVNHVGVCGVKGELLTVRAVGLNVNRGGCIITDEPCDIMAEGQHGYYFFQSRLVEHIAPKRTITIDGKDIEISDESYQALKKQFNK